MKQGIPLALKQKHDDLRASLAAAAKEPGALGGAARELARVLEPHLAAEEKFVYPALGLLPALAEGRVTRDMEEVLFTTRQLKDVLPAMLVEHRSIQESLEKLRALAVAASRPTYERFADVLMAHIDTDEEVLYLAAILVGEHVALRLELEHAKATSRTVPPWQSRSNL